MIRELGVSDLGKCETAARSFYGSSRYLEDFQPARFASIWTQIMQADAGVIFAYEVEGAVAGAIGGMIHQDIYGSAMVAEEFFWFVQEQYRGAGVMLYRRFKEWAIGRGATRLQMVHLLDLMPDESGGLLPA